MHPLKLHTSGMMSCCIVAHAAISARAILFAHRRSDQCVVILAWWTWLLHYDVLSVHGQVKLAHIPCRFDAEREMAAVSIAARGAFSNHTPELRIQESADQFVVILAWWTWSYVLSCHFQCKKSDANCSSDMLVTPTVHQHPCSYRPVCHCSLSFALCVSV